MGIVRLALLSGLVISLYACAPSIQSSIERPLLPTSGLPGAEISAGPPLKIVYPATAIYPAGSVLPDPRGLSHLEALATWLQGNSMANWQVRSWVESTDPTATARAEKRRQLLSRFFERKGLNVTRWDWQGGEPEGAQLSLTMVTDAP
ncbi:MAG: hypothetical protein C0614_04015 [Desulfuromonas sp.]|nr:MAG: hypothetical protein C0614_04015 [Desulfuromonas sp.]